MSLVDSISTRAHKGWGLTEVSSSQLAIRRSTGYWTNAYLPYSFPSHGALLGHLRASTGLDDRNVECVHPFQFGPLVMAHNGIIISKQEQVPFQPVDSAELLMRIFNETKNTFSPDSAGNARYAIEEAICRVLSTTEGQQACWLYNSHSGDLYLWRVMSPLYVTSNPVEYFAFCSLPPDDSYKMLEQGKLYKINVLNPFGGFYSVAPFIYKSFFKELPNG